VTSAAVTDAEEAAAQARAVYGERFADKAKRVQAQSPHGRRPGWAVRPVIVKSGDDCRQVRACCLHLPRNAVLVLGSCSGDEGSCRYGRVQPLKYSHSPSSRHDCLCSEHQAPAFLSKIHYQRGVASMGYLASGERPYFLEHHWLRREAAAAQECQQPLKAAQL
jgi:hypothetical protein